MSVGRTCPIFDTDGPQAARRGTGRALLKRKLDLREELRHAVMGND